MKSKEVLHSRDQSEFQVTIHIRFEIIKGARYILRIVILRKEMGTESL